MTRLAFEAGVGKSTLSEWENGRSRPSLRELESVLACLKVTPQQRRVALQTLQAPRAIVRLAAEGDRPPVAGDLLHAMRLRRGLTQSELARSIGGTQGMVAKWERSEDWPSPERLYAVCFALGAHPEELSTVVSGRFEPLYSPLLPFDPDLAWGYYRSFNRRSPLYCLKMFGLMAATWSESQRNADAHTFLTFLYASHTRYLFDAGQHVEAGILVDKALARVDDGWTNQNLWLDALMTRVMLMRRKGKQQARPLVKLLSEAMPHVTNTTFKAWMHSELGVALALLGLGDVAVQSSQNALQLAGDTHEPYNEGYFRTSEHLNILMMLGDSERLKQFVQSPSSTMIRGTLRGAPDIFSGQLALIRAFYVLGDDAEAERERLWLETHITTHGLEQHRPDWDKLLPRTRRS
jgi:transcriptional regulator with XRE-family HTH domain